ncbi:MAG: hypothetical protein ACFFG0_06080 [Candidatus Thorarchaeota archaeon]
MKKFMLVGLLVFLAGCTTYAQTPKQEIITTQEIIYFENATKYNLLVTKYNELVDNNNNLIESNKLCRQSYNSIRQKERETYHYAYACVDAMTSVPKKPLVTKTICKQGCNFNMFCTGSMRPYFDCEDIVSVYTNVRPNEIKVCDIIGVASPDYPDFDWVIHQVVGVTDEGYITKGLANAEIDKHVAKFSDVKFKFIGVKYN